ncbi:MAG: fatty acid--CoA ligase family protein [Xanthobacteraceae bacterium]|nr:fatty acid--CoA ligase family protein [Xanthobacteraceae bacterium]
MSDPLTSVGLDEALAGANLACDPADLTDRSILLATPDQLSTALALIALDGIAARLVLCPGDVDPKYFGDIARTAAVDCIVHGGDPAPLASLDLPMVKADRTLTVAARHPTTARPTEWILLTSGTTGAPKLVRHDLAGLTAPIRSSANAQADTVWATFYDIRRYGGLQIFLRAMLGGTPLVLSDPTEPVDAHLRRLGRREVTHISGTPSHWRRVLMSGAASAMSPRYVRLSGEIADQAILDALQAAYPRAAVSHAYASTEAGVGFNVIDGREGFPAALITQSPRDAEVEIRIVNDTLQLRSPRTAYDYLDAGQPPIRAADGFVDTGDLVELRGDRYVFLGRRGGVINVGGQKVHPEEVEAVLNQHPAVQVSLVQARRNPITGALVVADVVLKAPGAGVPGATDQTGLADEILAHCRATLRPFKVPSRIRFVDSLQVAATGKLARPS